MSYPARAGAAIVLGMDPRFGPQTNTQELSGKCGGCGRSVRWSPPFHGYVSANTHTIRLSTECSGSYGNHWPIRSAQLEDHDA